MQIEFWGDFGVFENLKDAMRTRQLHFWLAGLLGLVALNASAQWLQQSFALQPGWNAIYLNVDATHATISELSQGSSVEEVWMWRQRLSTAQYFENPEAPSSANSRWTSWDSSLGDASSELKSMPANTAYLVKLGGSSNYTWNIVGRPVAPNIEWTTSGLNFFGLPSVESSPPSLETYFGQAGNFLNVAEIFAYTGGALGPNNPGRVFGLRTTPATRGKAFWMRAEDQYVRYFAPFTLETQSPDGFDFGATRVAMRFRLKNQTNADLVITLSNVASDQSPAGEKFIFGDAPVIVRGDLDSTTLVYGKASLADGPQQWTLKPAGKLGSEIEVVIGLDRSQMPGNPGDLYASVLRFTDSLGHAQMDVAVSGEVGSHDGLWIGEVQIDEVQHSLSTDNVTYGKTASSYPIRLIIHQESFQVNATSDVFDGTGVTMNIAPLAQSIAAGEELVFGAGTTLTLTENAAPNSTTLTGDLVGMGVFAGDFAKVTRTRLLQRVYLGILGNTLPGITNKESLLDGTQLANAVRISSVHLPFSEANAPWLCSGELVSGNSMTATVIVGYNHQASNPFVHTYHPDHDNLTADFSRLQLVGQESLTLQREMQINFQAAEQNFNSLAQTSQRLVGTYEETMTLYGPASDAAPNEKSYRFRGPFTLNRISSIDTLTLE